MILSVNIGNTNIRAAIGEKSISAQSVFYANEGYTINLIETRLLKPNNIPWGQIKECRMATVVPDNLDKIITDLQSKTGQPVKRIDIRHCGNLRTDQYTGLLGEDRVICCAYTLQKYTPPFVVIDCGTATTINVVNNKGEFLGGAILPGLLTGLNALQQNTAQLPLIEEIVGNIPILGTNTKENLKSGAVIGISCALEGFLQRINEILQIENQLKNQIKVNVIVTGGHAPVILPYCRFDYFHEPDLLMEGLMAL